MGRHSLPHGSAAQRTGARSGARRRTVAIATGPVLAVAAGSVVVLRRDLLSFGERCDGTPVRIAVEVAGIRADDAPAARATIRTDCGTGVS
ncbi:hypothetical protein AB0C96_33945 [Streptomyces sp. NPDC048506]|uniref:hypothetical protein n=1 Tax=Streptomyces sp. NPDC048506 TaxID=3155028 RepID=UPI003444B7F7